MGALSMQNNTLFFTVKIVVSCLVLISCSGLKKRSSINLDHKPEIVILTKPIRIQLAGQAGYTEKHVYHVSSVTKRFDQGQILREREEIVDFETKYTVENVKAGVIHVNFTTTKKDGVIDLHDLVMPRINEKLALQMTAVGKILKAGDYAKTSAFYLSPVALPEDEVKIGDTWFLEEKWINEKSSMPMKIELVSILKQIYEVNGKQFAEIETSGEVLVPKEVFSGVDFESKIVGRIIIALETGAVAWSEIRNNEKLIYPESTLEVLSCMEAKLIEPKAYQWPWATQPSCDPRTEFVYGVPGA